MANRFGRRQRRQAREKIATLDREARRAQLAATAAQRSEANTRARNMELETPFRQLTGRQRELVQNSVDHITEKALGELHKAVRREAMRMASLGMTVYAVSASLDRRDEVSVFTVDIPRITFNILVETDDSRR